MTAVATNSQHPPAGLLAGLSALTVGQWAGLDGGRRESNEREDEAVLDCADAGGPGGLIGTHPGVEFSTGDGKHRTVVGEADVLLLFANGNLVPVEVKRTAAGVDARSLELVDRLAAALEAPYDVVAVSQAARDYPDLPASIPQPADRPRLVISDDQILNRTPFWAVSSNPFAWDPRSETDNLERDSVFVANLEASEPDQPWDLVRDTLLEES